MLIQQIRHQLQINLNIHLYHFQIHQSNHQVLYLHLLQLYHFQNKYIHSLFFSVNVPLVNSLNIDNHTGEIDGLNYKQYDLKIDIGNRYVISRINTIIENTSEETKEFVSINRVPKLIYHYVHTERNTELYFHDRA